jgi:hypothetical protein
LHACRDLADIDADLQTAESELKHAEIGRDDLVKRHSKLKVCACWIARALWGLWHAVYAALYRAAVLQTSLCIVGAA